MHDIFRFYITVMLDFYNSILYFYELDFFNSEFTVMLDFYNPAKKTTIGTANNYIKESESFVVVIYSMTKNYLISTDTRG